MGFLLGGGYWVVADYFEYLGSQKTTMSRNGSHGDRGRVLLTWNEVGREESWGRTYFSCDGKMRFRFKAVRGGLLEHCGDC